MAKDLKTKALRRKREGRKEHDARMQRIAEKPFLYNFRTHEKRAMKGVDYSGNS